MASLRRVLEQGSRLSAVRLANAHAACDILELEDFHEDDLYDNLDWLAAHQQQIEDRLFHFRYSQQKPDLYLYDVTSSYLEGVCNALGAFGYCRDGKTGKMQVVYGLLCDFQGIPISIQAFPGNTTDTKTFGAQVDKVTQRFGGGAVTFVGDRGMIKGPQIQQLQAEKEHEFHYITAITKAQVESLLKRGVIQMSLFDETVAEVLEGKVRYVLRRNPQRAEEIAAGRKSKLASLQKLVDAKNAYLASPISSFRLDPFGPAPPGHATRRSARPYITRASRALHPDEPNFAASTCRDGRKRCRQRAATIANARSWRTSSPPALR